MEKKLSKIDKVEHVWTLLSQNSIIDSKTNNISLLGVVEQINVDLKKINEVIQGEKPGIDTKKKLIKLPVKIVSLWKRIDMLGREEMEFDGQIIVVSPLGNKLATLNFELVFKSTTKRVRTDFGIDALPFDGIGEYKFEVAFKEKDATVYKKVATVPIEMKDDVLKN